MSSWRVDLEKVPRGMTMKVWRASIRPPGWYPVAPFMVVEAERKADCRELARAWIAEYEERMARFSPDTFYVKANGGWRE
jgi:hypothetical protein